MRPSFEAHRTYQPKWKPSHIIIPVYGNDRLLNAYVDKGAKEAFIILSDDAAASERLCARIIGDEEELIG